MTKKLIFLNTWLDYEFSIYEPSVQWDNVAGIYIFCKKTQPKEWVPYYIGKCDSFQDRIPSHERWDEAQAIGATHIHVLKVPQQLQRDSIEKELVKHFQPPLNKQLK